MRSVVEIEDIEAMRRCQGIDDVELHEEVRGLRAGDLVRVTLVTYTDSLRGETLSVRITSICGGAFRGRLLGKPRLVGLSKLKAGSMVCFAACHIHSIAKRGPRHDS
jgi:hypothetical protein